MKKLFKHLLLVNYLLLLTFIFVACQNSPQLETNETKKSKETLSTSLESETATISEDSESVSKEEEIKNDLNESIYPPDESETPIEVAQPESLDQSEDTYDMTSYSGRWKASEFTGKLFDTGGTYIDLIIDENNQISGALTSIGQHISYIANAPFTGTITDNVGNVTFEDDNWGHSGSITFIFKENEILGNVSVGTEEYLTRGVRFGEIKFIPLDGTEAFDEN